MERQLFNLTCLERKNILIKKMDILFVVFFLILIILIGICGVFFLAKKYFINLFIYKDRSQ